MERNQLVEEMKEIIEYQNELITKQNLQIIACCSFANQLLMSSDLGDMNKIIDKLKVMACISDAEKLAGIQRFLMSEVAEILNKCGRA